MEAVAERFIKYAKINTQSDPTSNNCPSSPGQLKLASILMSDLLELGLEDVHLNSDGYVWGSIPPNTDKKIPVIGFQNTTDQK